MRSAAFPLLPVLRLVLIMTIALAVSVAFYVATATNAKERYLTLQDALNGMRHLSGGSSDCSTTGESTH